MEILIKIIQFFMSLSLLVAIHEFGHFIMARLFKIRVEKFYIFFDPWFSLFKWKRGDTEYGIGWLPLGGYVKIAGMIDESMDKEQMQAPPKPDEFRSKPAWQRFLVMIAGVTMNIILAFLIYTGICYTHGVPDAQHRRSCRRRREDRRRKRHTCHAVAHRRRPSGHRRT